MALAGDLAPGPLAEALGERPVRSYPALLSTHADALAWARQGGPEGGVVVADYQASPRGRGGLEWTVRPGRDLGFSLVVRPRLPAEREGWLYAAAALGLADALGGDSIAWPDGVQRAGDRAAALGVHAELGPAGVEWAVVTALVVDVPPPRGRVLAQAVAEIERRLGEATVPVLADYLRRCETVGRDVVARLIPVGPAGVVVEGRAATVLGDGALVVETAQGRRIAIRPQALGALELS